MKKKFYISIIFYFWFVHPVLAKDKIIPPLSDRLDELKLLVTKEDLKYLTLEKENQSRKYEVNSNTANLFPEIRLSINQEWNPDKEVFEEGKEGTASLEAEGPIYKPLTSINRQISIVKRDISSLELKIYKKETDFEVFKFFNSSILQELKVAVRKKIIENNENLLGRIRSTKGFGGKLKLDVLETELNIKRSFAQKVDDLKLKNDLIRNFSQKFGINEEAIEKVFHSLNQLSYLDLVKKIDSYLDVYLVDEIKYRLDFSPAPIFLEKYKLERDSELQDANKIIAEDLPTFTYSFKYSRVNDLIYKKFFGKGSTTEVRYGFLFSMPIFSFFGGVNRYKERTHRIAKANFDYEKKKIDLNSELEVLKNNLKEQKDKINLLKEIMLRSEEILKKSRRSYELSILDLDLMLERENEYAQDVLSYYQEKFLFFEIIKDLALKGHFK